MALATLGSASAVILCAFMADGASTDNELALMEVAIGDLQRVLRNPVCGRMNKSSVTGFLGELMVRRMIASVGVPVVHHGNQANIDLELPTLRAKIDVKCSAIKTEIPGLARHWGWALHSSAKRRDPTCTHFVCVALSNDFELLALYVVASTRKNEFPGGLGRFRSVQHAFVVPEATCVAPSLLIPTDQRLVDACLRLLAEGAVAKVDAHGADRLLELLQSSR